MVSADIMAKIRETKDQEATKAKEIVHSHTEHKKEEEKKEEA